MTNIATNSEEFVTKEIVAKRLNKTTRTVEVWMKAGLLPYVKLQHSVIFHWPTVVEELKGRMVGGVH